MQHQTVAFDYTFRPLNDYETFENAEPWRGQLREWECTLAGGRLHATANSFSDTASAEGSLNTLLRAWECVAYLQDQCEVRFVRDSADREQVGLQDADNVDRIFRKSYDSYPEPDHSFELTPDVMRLMEAHSAFRRQEIRLPDALKETLAVMSPSGASDSTDAAARYAIDRDVMSAIESLVLRDTEVATKSTARQTYRGPEWQWMQEALRLVALQIGRGASQSPSNQLSMSDFRTSL